MLQQLMASNRFISLASPDPDDSDRDIEPTEPTIPDKTVEDVSVDSETEYFDALETDDDTPYFQQGAEPPPREQWEIAAPIDFFNVQEVSQIFFSVQRRMASARSFNMVPSMLHMRLIN